MCGLVGVVSTGVLSLTEKKVFDELLHAGHLRGEDSFGVINVLSSDRSVEYYKVAGSFSHFNKEHDKQYEKFLNTTTIARIGHNRSATRGEVSTENAHPFMHKHITGVHNGTLRENIGQFKVDSDWLYSQIASTTDVPTFLSNVNGAYALMWYDTVQKRVCVARNTERPLFVTKATHANTFYFASEKLMLAWILDRNKVLHGDITPVPTGKLHKYPVEFRDQLIVEDIPEKKYGPSSAWEGDYDGYYGSYYHGSRNSSNQAATSSSTQRSSRRASTLEKQKALIEIEDWWPISRSIRKNLETDTYDEVFAIKGRVTGLFPPYVYGNGCKEGGTVVCLNVSKQELDFLVEKEHGMATVEVSPTNNLAYYIVPHLLVGRKEPINYLHYSRPGPTEPGIQASASVELKCSYATRLQAVPLELWAEMLTEDDIKEAIAEAEKPEVEEQKKSEIVIATSITPHKSAEALTAICGECGYKQVHGQRFAVVNGVGVCDTCESIYLLKKAEAK